MVTRLSGLSLVEMMVTVAVASILALYGGSFTANWLAKQKVQAAVETLQQGYARARALALRNGTTDTANSASYLVLVSNRVCVQSSTVTAIDCDSSVWEADLTVDSAVIANNRTSCIAFSSAGLPQDGSLGGVDCAKATSYTLTKGTNDASGYLQ